MSDAPRTRRILRSMLALAGPVALARLGVMGMGVVDTVAVGQLAPDELAWLALGWAPTGVLLVTGIGGLLGVQVLAARTVGQGRPEAAGTVWRRGMVLALLTGTAATLALVAGAEALMLAFGIDPELARGAAGVARILALSLPLHYAYVASALFAEAIARPLPGTVTIWLANVVNLAINLALVPTLGAEGSAWATVTGRAFMALALAAWVWRAPTCRDHGVRERHPEAPGYRAIGAVGAASALSQLAEAGAFSSMTMIAGRLGSEAVAAYQVLLNVIAVVFMVSLGMAAATAVLTSRAVGSGDTDETRHVGRVALGANVAVNLAAALVLVACATPIAAAFTSDASLAAAIAALLPIAALVLLPDGAQVVVAHALRARGDNWFPTASHLAAYVAVMPPLAWWLTQTQASGVMGLMQAILAGSLLSISVLVVRMMVLDGQQRRRAAVVVLLATALAWTSAATAGQPPNLRGFEVLDSLDLQPASALQPGAEANGTISFNLRAFGADYRMRLDAEPAPPGCRVGRFAPDGSAVQERCHARSYISPARMTRVTIIDGEVSMSMKLADGGAIFIEPLRSWIPSARPGQSVIYRDTDVILEHLECGNE